MVASSVVSIINACRNNEGYTQTDFDSDHNALCDSFIDKFKKSIGKINDKIEDYNAKAPSTDKIKNSIKPKQITYGKAQKIVNMTFKYLSLFDNAKHFIHVFSLCHIAIDSYIIGEVNRLVNSCSISTTSVQSKTLKKRWSNYDEKDYDNMLDLERQIIKSQSYNGGKVLFFEEFDWWRKHFDEVQE